jgi:hypothetical protein
MPVMATVKPMRQPVSSPVADCPKGKKLLGVGGEILGGVTGGAPNAVTNLAITRLPPLTRCWKGRL